MSSVIDYLRRFIRKERFILLDHVLGQQGEDVFASTPVSLVNWRTRWGGNSGRRLRRRELPSRLDTDGDPFGGLRVTKRA